MVTGAQQNPSGRKTPARPAGSALSPSCYCVWATRDHHTFFHPLPGHWVCHAVGVRHVRTHSQGPCCQPARGQKAHHPASKAALYFHMKQNWSMLLLVPPSGGRKSCGRAWAP